MKYATTTTSQNMASELNKQGEIRNFKELSTLPKDLRIPVKPINPINQNSEEILLADAKRGVSL